MQLNPIHQLIIDLVNECDKEGYILLEEVLRKYEKKIKEMVLVRNIENGDLKPLEKDKTPILINGKETELLLFETLVKQDMQIINLKYGEKPYEALLQEKQEEIERLNEVINKMDDRLVINGREIIERENQRAEMQYVIDCYEKALKFYADENSYITKLAGMDIEATVMIDKGLMAKEALEKGNEEGSKTEI